MINSETSSFSCGKSKNVQLILKLWTWMAELSGRPCTCLTIILLEGIKDSSLSPAYPEMYLKGLRRDQWSFFLNELCRSYGICRI